MGFALVFGASAALAPEADARATISTFSVVKGDVLVRHATGDLTPAHEGDVVVAGDALQALPPSVASLLRDRGPGEASTPLEMSTA